MLSLSVPLILEEVCNIFFLVFNQVMASNSIQDECEFDQSFFSNLADNIVESDTNDIYIETQMEDGIPNTRERPGMGIKELRYKRKAEVAVGRDPCPDTRDWSKAKRLRADQKGTVVRNDTLPFDVIANKKSAALAIWQPSLGLAEVTQMRGNFWRTTGFCINKKSYLYPEEALLLAERSVLLVESEGQRITYHKLYESVIDLISLECHLAYLKLKTLDYLVFRHSKTIRSFEGDADVLQYLLENPGISLLKAVVAYDVYSHTHKWSKKMMSEPPVGYIVVMTGDLTFSGRVLLRLLDEAQGIPIIFAAVMPTGHVMLEEFTDSMKSLNWENIYAKPIEFKSKIEKAQELELELAKSSGERLMENLDNSKMDDDTVEDIEEEEDDEDGEEEVDDDDEVEVEEEGDESNTLRNIDSENEIADECEGEGSDEDENKHEELVDQGEKNTERGDEEINRNDIFEVESSALGGDLAGFLDDDELYVFPPEVEKLFLQDGNIVIGDDKGVRGSSSSSSSNNGLTIALETPRTHIRDIFYQDREVIDLLTPESLSPESLSPKTVPVDTMDDCTEDSNGFE